MRTRLAMMHCAGPYTTPWMKPEGGEAKLRILFLMPGEEVVLQIENDETELAYQDPGEYYFQPKGRYRFQKKRPPDAEGSPTMVEVMFNG